MRPDSIYKRVTGSEEAQYKAVEPEWPTLKGTIRPHKSAHRCCEAQGEYNGANST